MDSTAHVKLYAYLSAILTLITVPLYTKNLKILSNTHKKTYYHHMDCLYKALTVGEQRPFLGSMTTHQLIFLTYYCAWTSPDLFPCPSCALYAGVLDLCVYLCVCENLQGEKQKELRNKIRSNLCFGPQAPHLCILMLLSYPPQVNMWKNNSALTDSIVLNR